ncbi:MAG: efflux RND transporter periplasmic adaptor subunit [Acidobacteria bacterium]|nr:efflux RND transporter periplasmic adaptor subunit [Acidobacteriota bacterium]
MRFGWLCWLAAAIAMSGCSHDQEKERVVVASAAARELVTTLPVRMVEAATNEFVAPARLEVSPNYVAHVNAPLAGRIIEVLVRLGDSVTKGQPLLEIESPDTEQAESEYRSATAQLSQSEATLAKAESDHARLADLFEHNAVAQKEVLYARTAVAHAKAAVDQARATRDQASRKLEIHGLKAGSFRQKVVVRAPLAGKVLEMNVVAGEYRNDTSATMLRIADLSRLWVTSEVPESSIRFCRIGGSVQVELIAYPEEKIYGKISYLADTVDAEMRTVKVRADIDNSSGKFRPDMFGRARFSTDRRMAAWVPEKAVVHKNGRNLVFVDGPGDYAARDVVLGGRMDDGMVITSGLSKEDKVVVDGAIYLARNLK